MAPKMILTIMSKPNQELRISSASITTREKMGSPGLTGYAVKFGDVTTIGDQFDEVVSRDAFKDVDMSNVFALYNHDWNTPLARSGRGLDLTIDETGLRFDLTLPDTTAGRDLQELVRTGVVEGMSFGFTIEDDNWEKRDGLPLRTINAIDELFEITVTPVPAYPTTEVGLRSMDAALNEAIPEEVNSTHPLTEAARQIVDTKPESVDLGEWLKKVAE